VDERDLWRYVRFPILAWSDDPDEILRRFDEKVSRLRARARAN
jgi:hypothetical protein